MIPSISDINTASRCMLNCSIVAEFVMRQKWIDVLAGKSRQLKEKSVISDYS